MIVFAGHAFASIENASWSPDGSRLAYLDYAAEAVKVIDVTTGETTRVGHGALPAWPAWVDNRTLIVEVCDCPG